MATTQIRSPYNRYQTRVPVPTPQNLFIPGQEEIQAVNNAGGVAYKLDPWKQLDRFLILGTEGGTYYVSERKLTIDNARAVRALIESDGLRVVRTVVEISQQGRAPKADPGLFVLAMAIAFGDKATKRAVHEALPSVARIGTHLFTFVEFALQFRGWGRALREAVAHWYTSKDQRSLAYQAVKYQQRNGWSHRDLLRLTHAKREDNEVFHWIVKGWKSVGEETHPDYALRQIWAFERAKRASDVKEIVTLIREYSLPRECIPTQWLKDKAVWEALLGDTAGQRMPMTAMIRNLATMSRVGLLAPMSEAARIICERLQDQEALRAARVHPIQLLSALRVYSSGGTGIRGLRSRGDAFEPLPQVNEALERAFYYSFGNVEASGKRTLLALDVSNSMSQGEIAGVPGLTPAEAEAAMAMVTARSEWSRDGLISYPLYHSIAFSSKMVPFALSPTDTLKDITVRMDKIPYGATDCSQPMLYALKHNIAVDTFVIYTDNETWQGHIHPSQALEQYRKESNIPSRLVVVGLTSTGFSIANPQDPGMLDLVGFDTAAPNILSRFSRGEI